MQKLPIIGYRFKKEEGLKCITPQTSLVSASIQAVDEGNKIGEEEIYGNGKTEAI